MSTIAPLAAARPDVVTSVPSPLTQEVSSDLPAMWTQPLVSARLPPIARSRVADASKRGLRRQPALDNLQARYQAGLSRRNRRQQQGSIVSITDMLNDEDDEILPCYSTHQRGGSEDAVEFRFEDGLPTPPSFYEVPAASFPPSLVAAEATSSEVSGFPSSWYVPSRTKLNDAQIRAYRALGHGRPPLHRATFAPRASTPTEIAPVESLSKARVTQYQALGHGLPPLARFRPLDFC